jgi:hypothetical protein
MTNIVTKGYKNMTTFWSGKQPKWSKIIQNTSNLGRRKPLSRKHTMHQHPGGFSMNEQNQCMRACPADIPKENFPTSYSDSLSKLFGNLTDLLSRFFKLSCMILTSNGERFFLLYLHSNSKSKHKKELR